MTLVSIPANPVPEDVVSGTIKTPDGAELRFARWAPPAGRKGTVCVFTGRSEQIEKYFETVRDLRDRGFAVAMIDWRGQGHSSRRLRDPRKGYVRDFSDFEVDVETFVQQVVLPDCPPPFFALAHSMGGAVMLRVARAGKRWFDRMVLSAPMIDLPGSRTSFPARALLRVMRLAGQGGRYVPGGSDALTGSESFINNPFTSDPVRYARNAAILEEDPTLGIGSPTVAWADTAFRTMHTFRGMNYPSEIRQPILMLAASNDSMVSTAAIEAFAYHLRAVSLDIGLHEGVDLFCRQAALDAAGGILAVLAEAGEPGDFVFMDLRIDVENSRAAAMLVERAIAQFVENRARGCALQHAQRPETVRNDGDHPGFQPHLLFGRAGFAARGPDHFGEL